MNNKVQNTIIEDALLLAYLDGKLSGEDVEKVEAWYAESPENARYLDQLHVLGKMGKSVQVVGKKNLERSLADIQRRIQRRERRSKVKKLQRRTFYAIAGVAAVLTIGLFGLWVFSMADRFEDPIFIRTGIAERMEMALQDGTGVSLNACSHIEYKTGFFSNIKEIRLEGEAFFNVNKDKAVHLLVYAGGTVTEVLGTQFNIRANSEESLVTITLLEGKIDVRFDKDADKQVALRPNEQLTYDKLSGKVTIADCGNASKNSVEWMNGKLYFDRAAFYEIAQTLERNYNVEIIFGDDTLKNERFTCVFDSKDNIYNILSILRLTYKFDYTVSGRQIHVSSLPASGNK